MATVVLRPKLLAKYGFRQPVAPFNICTYVRKAGWPGIGVSRTFSTTETEGVVLHSEWIGPSDRGSGASSSPPLVFLHGLLGNGRNVKTMAKSVCRIKNRPGLLIDLRGHGQSKGRHLMTKAGSSTTLHDCVLDVHRTIHEAGIDKDSKICMIGHSLGGRLSLMYAHNEKLEPRPEQVWLLDTVPGSLNQSVVDVLDKITVAQQELQRESKRSTTKMNRKSVSSYLMDRHGFDFATAQWLASSFRASDQGGHEFGFDLGVARDVVANFNANDFLQLLQQVVDDGQIRVDLVRGGKNRGWKETNDALKVLENMQGDLFEMHLLDEAGHWVHIDDLPGLLKAVERVYKQKVSRIQEREL